MDENRYLKKPQNGQIWSENATLLVFKYLFVFSLEYPEEQRKSAKKL